jgi:hypothetical protein
VDPDPLAGLERCDRRANMTVRSLDDRVPASQNREGRERRETALRGHRALPPQGHGTRDRAVERATCLVDALPPHRDAHRRCAAIEHAPRGLKSAPPLIDALADATGDASPSAGRTELLAARIRYDELRRR